LKQYPATFGEFTVALQFLGGDTGGGGSPRLYQVGEEYLVQGYIVTEPGLLAKLDIPEGETVVRVPQSLWMYLPAAVRTDSTVPGSHERTCAAHGDDATAPEDLPRASSRTWTLGVLAQSIWMEPGK
jgi:hypothetical protein